MNIVDHESIFISSKNLEIVNKIITLNIDQETRKFNKCAVTNFGFDTDNNQIIHLHTNCVSTKFKTSALIDYSNVILAAHMGTERYYNKTYDLLSLLKPYTGTNDIEFFFTDLNGNIIDVPNCYFIFHLVRVENLLENLLKRIKIMSKGLALAIEDQYDDDQEFDNENDI